MSTDEGEIIVIDGPLPPIEEIIHAHNPYGGDVTFDPGAFDAVLPPEPALELAGLARNRNAQDPVRVRPSEVTPAQQAQLLYWSFGGNQHAVAKAMRIPYQYRRPDGTPARSHLLIGYEVEEDV